MNVALILESFQPQYWGGRETRWNRLVPFLSGSNSLTIYGDFSKIDPEKAFTNSTFAAINLGPLPKMYKMNGNRSSLHALLFTFRLLQKLKSNHEIVLIDQTPLISIPLLRIATGFNKQKLIVTWHEIWSYPTWLKYSKLMAPLGFMLERIAVWFTPYFIVPSEDTLSSLRTLRSRSRVKLIANGIESFRTTMDRTKKDDDTVRLLYVGRLIKHKNCIFLIQLLEAGILNGARLHLTLVGDGPERENLKATIASLRLNDYVSMYSGVPTDELNDIYLSSDVFVFPSEREGFGISVAEAISYHLPILLYDVNSNAARDLILNYSQGYALKSLSVKEWLSAIQTLVTIGEQSNNDFRHKNLQSWDDVARIFLNYLTEVRSGFDKTLS